MAYRSPCRQNGEFDPETGRPFCQHGVPMLPKKGNTFGKWRCAVRQREIDSEYSKSTKGRMRGARYDMTPGRQSKRIINDIKARLRAAGVEV